jgi:hypothetical protein
MFVTTDRPTDQPPINSFIEQSVLSTGLPFYRLMGRLSCRSHYWPTGR